MIVQLTPTWILTTDHAASNYGIPVLVNRATNEAHGPGDIVKPYPSWDLMTARHAVARMAKNRGISSNSLVAAFLAP